MGAGLSVVRHVRTPGDFIGRRICDAGMSLDQERIRSRDGPSSASARARPGKARRSRRRILLISKLPKSVFEGYRQTRSEDCEVLAIIETARACRS